MPLRFTRRVRLIPGLRVNFSKSGASPSIGHRRARYTFVPRGRRVSVGGHDSGLFLTQQWGPLDLKAGPRRHLGVDRRVRTACRAGIALARARRSNCLEAGGYRRPEHEVCDVSGRREEDHHII